MWKKCLKDPPHCSFPSKSLTLLPTQRTGEMAQSVKHSPYNYEDLRSIPRINVEKSSVVMLTCNYGFGEAETGKSLSFSGQ